MAGQHDTEQLHNCVQAAAGTGGTAAEREPLLPREPACESCSPSSTCAVCMAGEWKQVAAHNGTAHDSAAGTGKWLSCFQAAAACEKLLTKLDLQRAQHAIRWQQGEDGCRSRAATFAEALIPHKHCRCRACSQRVACSNYTKW
jgi:hypothetical protein